MNFCCTLRTGRGGSAALASYTHAGSRARAPRSPRTARSALQACPLPTLPGPGLGESTHISLYTRLWYTHTVSGQAANPNPHITYSAPRDLPEVRCFGVQSCVQSTTKLTDALCASRPPTHLATVMPANAPAFVPGCSGGLGSCCASCEARSTVEAAPSLGGAGAAAGFRST